MRLLIIRDDDGRRGREYADAEPLFLRSSPFLAITRPILNGGRGVLANLGRGAAPERGEQRAGTSSSDSMSHKIQKGQNTVAVRGTSASDLFQAASPSHHLDNQAAMPSPYKVSFSSPSLPSIPTPCPLPRRAQRTLCLSTPISPSTEIQE